MAGIKGGLKMIAWVGILFLDFGILSLVLITMPELSSWIKTGNFHNLLFFLSTLSIAIGTGILLCVLDARLRKLEK